MKKLSLFLIFVFILVLSFPQLAFANMAAPKESDIGSSITFEKNDTISVLSEVLDITVEGSQADIVATYKMKNTSDENISTKSMFLSPNIESSDVKVVVNGKDSSLTVQSYIISYNTEVKTDGWQYKLTHTKKLRINEEQTVDAITFDINFTPNEEYEIIVSYNYRLGGYPDSDFDAKNGIIQYYLTPASMWKDFTGLTINLSLDEDMPIISSSNLEFKKVSTRKYQYVSDTLPKENLEIVIDENWYQNIISTIKNPYLFMTIIVYFPYILIGLIIIVFIIWRVHKRKKEKIRSCE